MRTIRLENIMKRNEAFKYSSRELAFIERKFLNTGHFHSVAAACLKFEPDYHDKSYYGSLYINDCNRIIDLDFDLDTEEGIENTIYKLKTLAELCNKGVEHIEYMKQFIIKPEIKNEQDKTDDLQKDES